MESILKELQRLGVNYGLQTDMILEGTVARDVVIGFRVYTMGPDAEQNAVFEISKYPVKDTDVIRGNKVTEENVQTVKDLDKALAYKRLISYGGLLKEIHKELNLGDAEDGDLIHIDEDSDEVANGAVDVMAYWHVGLNNYVISRRNDNA